MPENDLGGVIKSPTPLTTYQFDWPGIKLYQGQNVAAQEAVEPNLTNHLILLHTTPLAVPIAERADDLHKGGIATPGDINLISAGEASYCRWEKPLSFVRLEIEPQFLQQVAARTEGLNPNQLDLAHMLRGREPKIEQIVQWLQDEVQSGGSSGRLYVESLANVLAIHLLKNHAVSNRQPVAPSGQLSQTEVARAIEYMQAHLEDDISLDELAAVVNISPSYLVRLFKRATGLAPHQYLINLRVNRAKELLQMGAYSVGQVATLTGFADQSHLHRHFKKLTGVTPKTLLS